MVLSEVQDFATGSQLINHDSNKILEPRNQGGEKRWQSEAMAEDIDLELSRPPYVHAALAGGLGGTTGDMMMHSLDTVKTRQQGDPHIPSKYSGLGTSYQTIWKQEGIRRGLYGGVLPAFLGSFSGTVIFFGSYEWSKRLLLDAGVNPSVSYLAGGFFADLAAVPLYVPSEVLKTRLQMQGRFNNPYFKSGYNYRSTWDAARTIIRTEGVGALFYGLKATLYRDLPYSALQFAFWEQEQNAARYYVGKKDIGLTLEILTGATAGSMAGIITCPLDVVKTKIQTQIVPSPQLLGESHGETRLQSTAVIDQNARVFNKPSNMTPQHLPTIAQSASAATLDTSSVVRGLGLIYKTEGLQGLFRGVGPRAVWTGIQSGTMFVLYQSFLRWFEKHPLVSDA